MKKLILLITGLLLLPLAMIGQFGVPSDPEIQPGDQRITGSLEVDVLPLVFENYSELVVGVDGKFSVKGTAPTITLNVTPNPVEFGSTTTLSVSGGIVNSLGALTAGVVSNDDSWSESFGGTPTYSYTSYDFVPRYGVLDDVLFSVTQHWELSPNSGDAVNSKLIPGVFPIMYGVSTTDYSSDLTGAYSDLTKWVTGEGDKFVDFTGTGYLYFLIPTTHTDTDLSSILDHNGFENLTAFDSPTPTLPLSSSGLTYNWVQNYVVYKYSVQVVGVNWKDWNFIQ